jgi:NAD(P)-dependent dehydrogenase (short-subunit alcohol dehydrogenase family)
VTLVFDKREKMDFKDKVVLITGAGRGYGREVAKAFAAEGAGVALNDISPGNLNSLVEEIQAAGGEAKAYVQDIAKKVPVQGLVMHVEDDFGKIDILINHSAVEPKKSLLEIDEWDWQRTIMVNLSAAFLMTQSVGRIMKKNGGGVIINLIPLAGRGGLKDRTAYVASMMGLIGFTRQAADELVVDNIRVHAVCSGIPEMHQAQRDFPSSFNDSVLYLCGDDAANLHGEIINIEEKI